MSLILYGFTRPIVDSCVYYWGAMGGVIDCKRKDAGYVL